MVSYILFRRTHDVTPILTDAEDKRSYFIGDYLTSIVPMDSPAKPFYNTPKGIYNKDIQQAMIFKSPQQVALVANLLYLSTYNYETSLVEVSDGNVAFQIKLKRDGVVYYLGDFRTITDEQYSGLVFPSKMTAEREIEKQGLNESGKFNEIEIIEIKFPHNFIRQFDSIENELNKEVQHLSQEDKETELNFPEEQKNNPDEEKQKGEKNPYITDYNAE